MKPETLMIAAVLTGMVALGLCLVALARGEYTIAAVNLAVVAANVVIAVINRNLIGRGQ